MQVWLNDLQHLLAHGDAVVLVTVARGEGSGPREAGTKREQRRKEAWTTGPERSRAARENAAARRCRYCPLAAFEMLLAPLLPTDASADVSS